MKRRLTLLVLPITLAFASLACNGDETPSASSRNSTEADRSASNSVRLAFYEAGAGGMYTVNADGSNLFQVTDGEVLPIAWSPDGTEFLILSNENDSHAEDQHQGVYVIGVGGTDHFRLPLDSESEVLPASWSPDGDLILFVASDAGGNLEVFVMNADGTGRVNLTQNPANDVLPAWSPDGSQIAFISARDGVEELYVMDRDGSDQRRLTSGSNIENAEIWLSNFELWPYCYPAWSPDGTRILIMSSRDTKAEIYSVNVDHGGKTNLSNSPAFDVFPDWSPDGMKIAFTSDRAFVFNQDGAQPNDDIYVMNADGSSQTRLTYDGSTDWLPRWSPDGNHIAFVALRDFNREIYVMNVDGSNQTNVSHSDENNWFHMWSPLRP